MGGEVFERASIRPDAVRSGDSAEFIITLLVGPGYTPGPSRIVLDLPATLGMSRPELLHQEADGFVEVYCGNPDVTHTKRVWDVEIQDFVSRERRSYRGMACRMFVLDLSAGVKAGDAIEVRWGDTGGGYGAGAKVTSVVPRPGYAALLHVRYFADPAAGLPDLARSFAGCARPVPDAQAELPIRILPREPHHLRLVRKVDAALLLCHDLYWNVPPVADAAEVVDADAGAAPVRNDFGVFEYPSPHVRVRAKALPLLDAPAMDGIFEGMNLYWGDIHTHSAYSNDCFEREKLQMTPGDLMAFARRRAGLDFFAVTDHHQPWDVERNRIGRQYWEMTLDDLFGHDAPGEFLVFPGFEFRCPRGDTAVVLGWQAGYEEIDRPDWTDVRELWRGLEGRDYLTIPHFHNVGRLDDGLWWDNVGPVEPVLEVFSCHGSCEREDALENGRPMIKRFRRDRCAAYLLAAGYRYGLVGNSDGHKGHVGTNGLTAVFADRLDRSAVFAAYRDRRVYGTTNARIRLVFTANGQLMGSVLSDASEKAFLIDVVGEGRLKKVDVFRNGEPYRRFVPDGPTKSLKRDFTADDDGPASWYVRVTQTDNHVAWSSPIWFT